MKRLRHTLSSLCLLAASIAGPSSSQAGEILFAMVSDTNAYVAEGLSISGMLAGSGYSVTNRYLNDVVYSDYGRFDQIFVYDLASTYDDSPTQMANYAGISQWYNGRSNQNLILDGRIIGSSAAWTDMGHGLGTGGESGFIRNYRDQLGLRGGGLVLGTDHSNFTFGINYINRGIGVGDFSGFYYDEPYEAYVDPSSPLYVPELEACTQDPDRQCINDNTSSSFVATGQQANGQTLNPVAYHGAYHGTDGAAYDYAAVSTTMGGLTTLTCVGTDQQPCVNAVSEPLPLALLVLGLAGMQLGRRFRVTRSSPMRCQ